MSTKATVRYIYIDAQVGYQLVRGDISYSEAQVAEIQFPAVQAADIVLDPDTFNRYFHDDSLSLLETFDLDAQKALTDSIGIAQRQTLSYEKITLDSLGLSDAQRATLEKQLVDSYSLSDSVDVVVQFRRDHADNYSLSDSIDVVVQFRRDHADSITIADSKVLGLTKPLSDNFSFSDLNIVRLAKSVADRLNFVHSHTAQFDLTFSDAFSLDDTSTIDAITKQTNALKSNVFSFTDIQTMTLTKDLSASTLLSDSAALAHAKSQADNFSFSETFGYAIATNNTALNSLPINTHALN